MSQKQNFIKTTDMETAEKLETMGFKLMSHIGNMYTFLNNNPQSMNFENVDANKIAYDNKLSL